jgi:RNA polymerase sigma factor (sigma-70 family)
VNQLLRYLRAAAPAQAPVDAPDRELLARFIRERDGGAFAALVARHGPTVWATCRRLLDRAEDAEDAFQAVFLTLARRASAVGENVPAWLHGVARRVAANVRRDQRRDSATDRVSARALAVPPREVSWREGLAVLDEELARLPERYRAVLIVCCLDGRTRDEAAQQLGWSVGQVKGCLERARELLRQRLVQRGFELGAVLLAATVAAGASGAAPVWPVSAPFTFGAGSGVVSPAAVALSESVVSAMFVQKLKTVVAVLVVVAGAVGGALAHRGAEGTEPVPKVEKSAAPAAPGQEGKGQPPVRVGVERPADPAQPKQPFTVDPPDPKMLREPGNRFDVLVVGSSTGECWGTELYFYDSDLRTAAVHAGLVKECERAVITVTVLKCPKSGAGSVRNGVKSGRWDEARPTDTALLLQRAGKAVTAVEKLEGLTPDEVVEKHLNERVPVAFVVGSVRTGWHTGFGAKEARTITLAPTDPLKSGRRFEVILSGKAATHAFNLKLVEMSVVAPGQTVFIGTLHHPYFERKLILVTGKVEATGPVEKKGTNYRLVVLDLEDLTVLK